MRLDTIHPLSGGLRGERRVTRPWRWRQQDGWLAEPVRCRRKQWYLLRGAPSADAPSAALDIQVIYQQRDTELRPRRVVPLRPLNGDDPTWLAWIQTPNDATHLSLRIPDRHVGAALGELTLYPVAERDPKCHPLANTPRWSSYKPPFPIDRVVLPESLESLATLVTNAKTQIIRAPATKKEFARHAIGAAIVVDPQWVSRLGLTWRDLEQIASASWMIIDLDTLASTISKAGLVEAEVVARRARHEIMSARVEYADVPTRGFALQDVLPFSTMHDDEFSLRGIRATRAWKRFADEMGIAPLLISETPWESRRADWLSAALATEHGELIATDLPWLTAGHAGKLLAPEIVKMLTRAHLAQPIDDANQYWNRWDDARVVIRDIADLARRFPNMTACRFASQTPGVARLGLTIGSATAKRQCVIATGRIDQTDAHDGMPPEPMLIFMKWLAREQRDNTTFAAQTLADTQVIWQFDSTDGLSYAVLFDAAPLIDSGSATRHIHVVNRDACVATRANERANNGVVLALPGYSGVFGDRCFSIQEELTRSLTAWLSQPGVSTLPSVAAY